MIVVTGHMGFIGQHLMRVLGGDVYGLDLKRGYDILTCDLPDADRVYHLAARTNALSTDLTGDAEANIMGTVRILERYGDRVVLASSSMVNWPVNSYAISKLACEHYALMHGAAVVRLPNVYGNGGHSVVEAFGRADVMQIRGDGRQLRTFVHVSEAVKALLQAESGHVEIVHGRDMTVTDVARMFPNKPVEFLPAVPGDLPVVVQ